MLARDNTAFDISIIITQEKLEIQKMESLGGGTPSEVRGYCARGDI